MAVMEKREVRSILSKLDEAGLEHLYGFDIPEDRADLEKAYVLLKKYAIEKYLNIVKIAPIDYMDFDFEKYDGQWEAVILSDDGDDVIKETMELL